MSFEGDGVHERANEKQNDVLESARHTFKSMQPQEQHQFLSKNSEELQNVHEGRTSGQQATHAKRLAIPLKQTQKTVEMSQADADLTARGVCTERAALNVGFCNEMRTVSKHCWWRREEVRALWQ